MFRSHDNKGVELRKMTFFCPKLKKEIEVLGGHVEVHSSESECELCGSHGYTRLSFDCECGENHKVEINSF